MAVAKEKIQEPVLVKASARQLHVSPRKMRLVTNAVKDMPVLQALAQLAHMNKKAAPMLVKLIQSAVANAKNNFSLDPESLYIKSVTTDMGNVMKRYFPRARGSAFVIRRKLCHVNIVIESRGVAGKRKGFMKLAATSPKKDDQEPKAKTPDASAELSAKEEPKKTKAFKTSEQRKMNTVQQKRRLFNRKSGE